MDNFLIFKNTKKEEGSNQPDYKILVKENGQFITWGAGWIKQGNNGSYISCSKSKPKPKQNLDDEFINA